MRFDRALVEEAAGDWSVAQMGNVSFRSGQRLAWDKPTGKFTDDSINTAYLMKEYHNGYKLPVV